MLGNVPEDAQPKRVSPPVRRRRIVLVAGAWAALAVFALIVGALSGQPSTPLARASITETVIPTPTPTASARPTPSASPEPVIVPTFDRAAHSIDDPTSIWVVVNKRRPLSPVDYVPPDLVDVPVPHVFEPSLRKEASEAAVAMLAAFTVETGLELQSQSAYRSYDTQVRVYDQDVASNGQAFADTSTARPGFSEHQTGLAIDISALPGNCSLNACFADTPHGQWLAANAWRFGFLLRYPADKVEIAGFHFEPWHYRYIGVDLASEMHDTGVTTLEEFFGLPPAPSYD